jgi:enoyl-CoA hydratase
MIIERRGAVALVRLRGGKANAMSRELLAGIVSLMDDVEAGGAGAVVLTGYETYFSAGLALPSLVELDRPAMREFIDHFGAAMLRVFRCARPVVAAVNGHAVAGGCVLALMADVRLMTEGKAKIGLPETQLGIGLPSVVIEPVRLALPASSLVPVALEGRMFTPAEARALALVDDVVPEAELLDRAVARAAELAAVPPLAYAQVKQAIRRPALELIERVATDEREKWLDTWFSDEGQRRLKAAVARLSGASA